MGNTVIIGAGGNAKKIVDIFILLGIDFIGYISSEEVESTIYGYKVIGKLEDIETVKKNHNISQAVVSIGDNFKRKQISELLKNQYITFINVIHPTATISHTVEIGHGNMIMAGAVIHANARIGNSCLIDTNAVVEHDVLMDDFSSVAPGAIICGSAKIGEVSAIGAGATVLEKRSIGNHSVIGAGSTVIDSLPDHSLAYGVPAKVIRKRKEGERYLL
jgi:sugar O-acyltransferase (sialic acid O-acetyltransferase NeuD family)